MGGSAIAPGVVAEAAAAARELMRLPEGSETEVLARMAASALCLAEAFCGVALIVRGFEDVIGAGSGWQALRQAPVVAIDGATELAAEGAPFVLPVADYAVDIDGEGRGWVRIGARGAAGRVTVAYRAGLVEDYAALPPALGQGCAMLVAHLFENRTGEAAPPAAVAALWRPYRRMAIGAGVRP